MENNKTEQYIMIIVAIVAVVAIATILLQNGRMQGSGSSNSFSEDSSLDSVGQVISVAGKQIYTKQEVDALLAQKASYNDVANKIDKSGVSTTLSECSQYNVGQLKGGINTDMDTNKDGVITGEELCNYNGRKCIYTHHVFENVPLKDYDGNLKYVEIIDPPRGCYGGISSSYLQQHAYESMMAWCCPSS